MGLSDCPGRERELDMRETLLDTGSVDSPKRREKVIIRT